MPASARRARAHSAAWPPLARRMASSRTASVSYTGRHGGARSLGCLAAAGAPHGQLAHGLRQLHW